MWYTARLHFPFIQTVQIDSKVIESPFCYGHNFYTAICCTYIIEMYEHAKGIYNFYDFNFSRTVASSIFRNFIYIILLYVVKSIIYIYWALPFANICFLFYKKFTISFVVYIYIYNQVFKYSQEQHFDWQFQAPITAVTNIIEILVCHILQIESLLQH